MPAWKTFTESQWDQFDLSDWDNFDLDPTGLVIVASDSFRPTPIQGTFDAGATEASTFVPTPKEDSYAAGANTTEAFVTGAEKVNHYGL